MDDYIEIKNQDGGKQLTLSSGYLANKYSQIVNRATPYNEYWEDDLTNPIRVIDCENFDNKDLGGISGSLLTDSIMVDDAYSYIVWAKFLQPFPTTDVEVVVTPLYVAQDTNDIYHLCFPGRPFKLRVITPNGDQNYYLETIDYDGHFARATLPTIIPTFGIPFICLHVHCDTTWTNGVINLYCAPSPYDVAQQFIDNPIDNNDFGGTGFSVPE